MEVVHPVMLRYGPARIGMCKPCSLLGLQTPSCLPHLKPLTLSRYIIASSLKQLAPAHVRKDGGRSALHSQCDVLGKIVLPGRTTLTEDRERKVAGRDWMGRTRGAWVRTQEVHVVGDLKVGLCGHPLVKHCGAVIRLSSFLVCHKRSQMQITERGRPLATPPWLDTPVLRESLVAAPCLPAQMMNQLLYGNIV